MRGWGQYVAWAPLTAPVPDTPETASVWRRALGSVAVDLGLLRRRRDFGLLVLGQTVSELGSMATFVAIPFQAYELTGSSLAVGLLGVAEFAPIMVLALVGGALADAFDRRRLVQIAEVGAAIVAGALLVNATLPDPHLWVLYVCSALLAAFTAVRRPPLDALIPRLVERDELKAASALQFSFHNMASLAGPALAGLLIAGAGLTFTYGVDVVSFAASLVVLNAMRTPPPPPDAEPPSWRTIREGLRYATSRQDLVGTYLVDMNAMFFGMPMALFPAIAKGYGGPEVLGLLYAAPSAGSIAVTLTSGWTARVHRHGRAVVFGAALWGVAIDRLRLRERAVAGRRVPGRGGRDGHGQRHLPLGDLERDDPRPPARAAGRRGDDLVVLGAAARRRRGGPRRRPGQRARLRRDRRHRVRRRHRRPRPRATALLGLRQPRSRGR